MVKINPNARDLVTCRPTVIKNQSFGVFYGENPLHSSFPLLLLEVSLVILISRLVRFLLKPLKQPRVVSDVIVRSLSSSSPACPLIFPSFLAGGPPNIGLLCTVI